MKNNYCVLCSSLLPDHMPNSPISKDEYDMLDQLIHGKIQAKEWIEELEYLLRSLSNITEGVDHDKNKSIAVEDVGT